MHTVFILELFVFCKKQKRKKKKKVAPSLPGLSDSTTSGKQRSLTDLLPKVHLKLCTCLLSRFVNFFLLPDLGFHFLLDIIEKEDGESLTCVHFAKGNRSWDCPRTERISSCFDLQGAEGDHKPHDAPWQIPGYKTKAVKDTTGMCQGQLAMPDRCPPLQGRRLQSSVFLSNQSLDRIRSWLIAENEK